MYSYTITSMHGYGRSTDLLSQTYIDIWENVASVTGTIIIVQTNIHHCSKVFTTGQAGLNPER